MGALGGAGAGLGANLLGGFFGPGVKKPSGLETSSFRQAAGTAGQLAGQGRQAFGTGLGAAQQAAGFFGNLLTNRTRLLAETAPEQAQIQESFRGAEQDIQSRARGGTRDLALAQLSRDRAATQSRTIAGIRSGAASNLAALGIPLANIGASATGGAGSLFGQVASALQGGRLGEAEVRGQLAGGRRQAGGDLGSFIFDLLRGGSGKGDKAGGGGIPQAPIGTRAPIGTPVTPR